MADLVRVRRSVVAAALLFALAGCEGTLADWLPPISVAPLESNAGAGRMDVVDRVVDGDTIDVEPGKGGSVRILGIDSPETVHPNRPVQCGGPESSAWAKAELPKGTEVRLVPDPTQDSVDFNGRELAYVEYRRPGSDVWVDFSVESARTGMSKAYVYDKKPVQRYEDILAAQNEARKSRIGLWNCPENVG